MTILSKKFKPNNLPLYSKTLEFFEDIKNVVVRSPALPEEPLWHQKPCNVDTALTQYGSKLENPNLLRNLALEKIDSFKNAVHIYTDASKTLADKTSAAFCVPKLNIERSVRLTDNVSIFAAELTQSN